MDSHTAGGFRTQRAKNQAWVGCAALWVGLVIVAFSVLAGLAALKGASFPLPQVRPATSAEAPDPAYADRTVVASPAGEPVALPLLQALALRIVLLALAAGVGAGVSAWGLRAWFIARHQAGGVGGVDDAAEQDATGR